MPFLILLFRYFVPIVIVLFAFATTAQARNTALVIGNSVYQGSIQPLDNPVNDATDVAAAFNRQGYDVTLALDLDKEGFRRALVDFGNKAEGAETALVYYAGHAVELDGLNYLMPIDAHLADRKSAKLDFITVSAVIDQISGATKLRMFVLDACRTDPFIQQLKSDGATRGATTEGLASMENEAGVLVAFAAAAGQTTPDGESGGNSPFTTSFLKAFEGPPLDVRIFMGKVRNEMRRLVPQSRPALYEELSGEYFIINPLGDAYGTEGDQTALSSESRLQADFEVAANAGTVSSWNDFVVRHSAKREHPIYQQALGKRRALIQRSQPNSVALGIVAPAGPLVPKITKREAVMQLQEVLKDKKCYWGAIDGIFGRGSTNGVRQLAATSGISVSVSANSGVDELLGATEQLKNLAAARCPAPKVVKKAKPRQPKPAKKVSVPKVTAVPAPAPPARKCIYFEGQEICN